MEPRDPMAEMLVQVLLMQYEQSPLRTDMRTGEAVPFFQWVAEMNEREGRPIESYERNVQQDAREFRRVNRMGECS